MKAIKVLVFFILFQFSWAQKSNYGEILERIKSKDFFTAQEMYENSKTDLSDFQKLFLDAYIENAFNRLEESNRIIDQLFSKYESQLSDRNKVDFLGIKVDNSFKLENYKEGKIAIEDLLKNYKSELTPKELEDHENTLAIMKALENEPKQIVHIPHTVKEKMNRDLVGLKNLKVEIENDTVDFIFDTGANISTTIKSIADEFKMKYLEGEIQVGTINGNMVSAKLAVCKEFKIGDISVQNAVFIVMNDEDLAFPQINYQIYGILGFPVMQAFREIQITQDNYFIVPKEETKIQGSSNMALDNLQPILRIDGLHYTFDTGATNTLLYYPYFKKFQNEIEKNYASTQVRIGGAGGYQEYEAYKIDYKPLMNGKEVHLKEVSVFTKDDEKEPKKVYGNVGQDLIGQFQRMTMNFHQMFIRFD